MFTDHKPLTFALDSSTDHSPRQTRHLSFIAKFTSDIRHVKGAVNVVADTLSRPSVSAVDSPIPSVDLAALAAAQDPEETSSSSLQVESIQWNGVSLLCDTSLGVVRPIIPPQFRRQVFQALHQLSHPGPKPSTRLVLDRFVWPGMKRDIRTWCSECQDCQASKVARHIRAPVLVFPAAVRRFGSLHVDIVGPLPPSEEHRYLLTIVDRFSRWPEAFPLVDTSASSCCRLFSVVGCRGMGFPTKL